MDSKLSENKPPRPLRRSTRQSSVKAVSYEPTPRGPLKRSKRAPESPAPVAVVNGSKDVENGSEDEASPTKKNRLDRSDSVGGSGDENGMEVQESLETQQELQLGQDPSQDTHQPKLCQAGAVGDVNLSPRVVLGERCQSGHAVTENADGMKTKIVKPSTEEPAAPIKSAVQTRSSLTRHDMSASKFTSMADYKSTMEAKAKSAGIHINNLYAPNKYPALENSYSTTITTRQRLNNITTQKETIQHKNQAGIKKTAVTKRKSKFSCTGVLCSWCFLLVLLCSATFLAYIKIPILQRLTDKGGRIYTAIKPEIFTNHLSNLESRFPSQRPELWKRTKIHLERHLKTAQPTEPVSLILAAGHKAERTLLCLAKGLASSFSSVLNASVLHIDGASKAEQDSDEVKLDIDHQLQAAFAGDKPVAVIHRLEELPPGSTLIFYRYCDHENAAFKQVFLLFTVLLPQDDVSTDQSLRAVEELVQDHVQKKLVGSDNQTAFNKMDTNKFGGLWSRISHLILPVVFEEAIQHKGCN